MKMHIRNIILTATYLLPVSALAQEQTLEPMLVEGRVWEYAHNGSWDNQCFVETLTLAGDSVVDGTTYKILRSDREFPDRLVREDHNRVYRYNAASDEEPSSETQLYDFNMSLRDSFEYPTGNFGNVLITVTDIGSVECIDGKQRMEQTWNIKNREWDSDGFPFNTPFRAMSSIGIIDFGTLADFYLYPLSAGGGAPTKLLRVADADGTVLYHNKYIDQYDLNPMLVDGRTWEYIHPATEKTGRYVETLTLAGDTTVNETVYKVLRSDRSCAKLVRESRNCVYRCDFNPESYSYSETKIYDFAVDFAMKKEKSFECTDGKGHKAKIRIKNFQPEYNNGLWLNCVWQVDIYSLSENGEAGREGTLLRSNEQEAVYPVGVLSWGTFADFDMEGGDKCASLMRVTDSDGSVLYYDKSLGYDSMDAVNANQWLDIRMYDIQGREIKNPEPGTVYIQGGKAYLVPENIR